MGKQNGRIKNDEPIILTERDIRERVKEKIQSILNRETKVRAKNESQKELIRSIKDREITICTGPAGSGKTYVSLAFALGLLRNSNNNYKKMYLIKSVTTLKGEELGFLKGNLAEKFEPFMMAFVINMEKMIEETEIKNLFLSDIIRPFPLAYIRGASLDDSIIIADECIGGNNKICIKLNNEEKHRFILTKKLPYYYLKYPELKISSYNNVSNKQEYNFIKSIKISKSIKTIKITEEGNVNPIECTNKHPFGILNNGDIEYIDAKKLKIGNILIKRKNKSGNHSILNENNYDILLGFLLGDGGLCFNKQKSNNIVRLRKQHSLKQEQYNKFCASLYNTNTDRSGKSGFTNEDMSVFQTKSYYVNNDFLDNLFSNKKKDIKFNIIKYFSERTLATWYMDDGSHYKYQVTFHTEGFTKKNVETLKEIIFKKYNIIGNVKTVKKKRKDRINEFNYYYVIKLKKSESIKLFKLISQYIHEELQYKLPDEFKNKQNLDLYETYTNFYDITTTKIVDIKIGDTQNVYNMEVENVNNYYVNNILTHNCQNVTLDNARTLLTRIGTNTKMVVIGDSNQIDLKNKEESSLEPLLKMFEDVEDIGCVRMSEDDTNIRNPIISTIESKFKEYYNVEKKVGKPRKLKTT